MNGYNLTRAWYQFKFDNPSKVRHIHSDAYFYIVDLWNRLGQKNEFGLPTSVTMESLQIGSYNTYKKCIDELVEFGFIEVVRNSVNQHTSKIIKLCKIEVVALSYIDKATIKATDKPTDQAIDKATDSIIEQYNNTTIEQHPFISWIESNCKSVSKMTKFLTDAEAERLVNEFDKNLLVEICQAMENHKELNKRYSSTNLTIRSWINMRKSNPIKNQSTINQGRDGLLLN